MESLKKKKKKYKNNNKKCTYRVVPEVVGGGEGMGEMGEGGLKVPTPSYQRNTSWGPSVQPGGAGSQPCLVCLEAAWGVDGHRCHTTRERPDPCGLMDDHQNYCGDYVCEHPRGKSWCCAPETNTMLGGNYLSMFQINYSLNRGEKNNNVQKS